MPPPLARNSAESESTKPAIKGAISECIPSSQAPPPPQLILLYSKEIEGEIRKRQTIFVPSEAIVFTYGAITSSSVRSLLQQAPLDLSGACTIRISPILWTEDRANRSDVPYSEYLAVQS